MNAFRLWTTRQLYRAIVVFGKLRRRRVVTLHHLACSGGTLFTKCLAAMPETMVLSEIHPDRAAQPAFHPLSQIRRGYGDALDRRQLGVIHGHFLREIELAHDIAESSGRALVVRDHAHVDFAFQRQTRSLLSAILSRTFRITPIVTVRHPIEVFVSLKKNNWFDGSPDDFCKAQLALLDAFPNAPVFRYEDLVADPETTIQKLCTVAGISFEPGFQDRLKDVLHLTGDSGRSGDAIEPRPPKPVSEGVLAAFDASNFYPKLVGRLGYKSRAGFK